MPELLKQADQPLFPETLWEKPQTKAASKKLLIIGGHLGQIEPVQRAYSCSIDAGIGEAKLILPDKLSPQIGRPDNVLYVRSTSSGSIAKSAIADIEAFTKESDGVLVSGGLSKHPDSTVVLEHLLLYIDKPLIFTDEPLGLIGHRLGQFISKPDVLLVSLTQGFIKLADYLNLPQEISPRSSLLNKVALAESISRQTKFKLVLNGKDLIVAVGSKTSYTKLKRLPSSEETAAYMAVYYMQHPKKFRALTTAAHQISLNY